MSAAQKGVRRRPLTEAEKASVSASLKGRVFSEQHKANLSAAHSARQLRLRQAAEVRVG